MTSDTSTQPSRQNGTCPNCGTVLRLRSALGGSPFPALLPNHDTTDDHGRPRHCNESDRVPVEWRHYLTGDPQRWAAYDMAFRKWLAGHPVAVAALDEWEHYHQRQEGAA